MAGIVWACLTLSGCGGSFGFLRCCCVGWPGDVGFRVHKILCGHFYSGLLRFTPVWSGFESPIGRGGESTSSPRWLRGVVEQRGVPFWNEMVPFRSTLVRMLTKDLRVRQRLR